MCDHLATLITPLKKTAKLDAQTGRVEITLEGESKRTQIRTIACRVYAKSFGSFSNSWVTVVYDDAQFIVRSILRKKLSVVSNIRIASYAELVNVPSTKLAVTAEIQTVIAVFGRFCMCFPKVL